MIYWFSTGVKMTNRGVEWKASDDFFHLCLDDTVTEKRDRDIEEI